MEEILSNRCEVCKGSRAIKERTTEFNIPPKHYQDQPKKLGVSFVKVGRPKCGAAWVEETWEQRLEVLVGTISITPP